MTDSVPLEWVLKTAQVFRTDGKLGGRQFLDKLTEIPLMVIRTRKQPGKEIIIRRADDILYMVYIYWDRKLQTYKYHYLKILFQDVQDYSDDMFHYSAIRVVGQIMNLAFKNYITFEEREIGNVEVNYKKLSNKIKWDWRR